MTIPVGHLVVISGPSGTGKSTLLRRLLDRCPLPLEMSVSATTRDPRPSERDGVDYHFLSAEEFAERRQAGEFLECYEVFDRGCWYGTLSDEVTPRLKAGKWVILEIDVEGTLAVVRQFPEAITIFVAPPSLEELERRLRDRGTESEAAVQRRLEVARGEMAMTDHYRHRVTNDDVDRAAHEICDLLTHSGE